MSKMDSFTHPDPITLSDGDRLGNVLAQLYGSANKIVVLYNETTIRIIEREGPYPKLFYEGCQGDCHRFVDRDNNSYQLFGLTAAQLIHPQPLHEADLVKVKVCDRGRLSTFVTPNYNNEVRKRSPP